MTDEDAIDGYVSRLVKILFLPDNTEFYLSSIGLLMLDAGRDKVDAMRQLDHAASVAKLYRFPIEFLKELDKAIPDYLKSGDREGLKHLHRNEYKRSERGKIKLDTSGLDERIRQHLGITQP